MTLAPGRWRQRGDTGPGAVARRGAQQSVTAPGSAIVISALHPCRLSSSWIRPASASCPMPPPIGDEGSDTLGNIARRVGLRVPTLRSLGLARVAAIGGAARSGRVGAFGRMAEASPGKDSVTGHWEMAGLVLDRPFPTFPNGFPPRSHSGIRAPHRPSDAREHRRLGHGDHRRAWRRTCPDRRAHRLHVGRQRVPDRGA